MELRHLRYFMAVAETGNLSRAAEKLFIAQPPLSVQIRQLEDELGTPLFVRHPKGVRLTAAGEALVPEARYLLDRAARVKERLHDAASGGHLALGFVPSASSTVLPDLLRRMRKQHPHLNIELREMISSEQAEALVAGHIDAGIARTQPQHPRLAVAARMADPFCLAMPTSQAHRKPGPVDLHSFADHAFVAFTRHRGPAYFDQSIHLCAKAGFSPRIRYEASTVHGVLDLVGAGLGVALVPASCALLGAKGAKFRGLRGPHPGEVLALLQRKSDAHPLLPLVQDAVHAIFESLERRAGGMMV
ncbi:LysR substrate-binding domain-containing protein [Variovorax sp. J22G21]|uniref:LysR family transcriptional regulator n=1 Tax=Variovorax fucosicus TaxID=3053517 RepID=UPI0025754F8A|nr:MULTISPECIES: LysR substrate-binding domain-containing protein [unclassified Variovorax]MDM0038434.1 LysR substrate-binding domain-containing protein [Variovorax sp. J22R193]MDM0063210.1 LysR substrate-binding domain-containing protein [Variovorax sp. J22G21]